MSSSLKTALILDSRIENLTDIESFGVKSSAQNNTFQQYASLSATSSLITYQCQIPSESIVCDRSVLQACDLCFQVNIDTQNTAAGGVEAIPANSNVWQWGITESLAPFPLTQCFSTIQSSINNCSVSINIGDILPQMLRMTSQRELQKYNSTTPAMVDDLWGDYKDAVRLYSAITAQQTGAGSVGNQPYEANSNPLGSCGNAGFDRAYSPRGSFPVSCTVYQYAQADGGFVSNSPISAADGNTFKVLIKVSVAEPIMLSPFLNCLPHGNQAGFMGINTMTLNFNVNSLQRAIRTAQSFTNNAGLLVPKYSLVVQGGSALGGATTQLFSNARLLCNFLTLNPSQSARIALRNVCEYTDFPRFITSANNAVRLPPCVYSSADNAPVPVVADGGRTLITSNNIQLNQIPSRFIIVVGEPTGTRNPAYTDAFCSIEGIQINFNNKSGIFASATQYELYSKVSVPSGSTQTWEEFRGWAVSSKLNNKVQPYAANFTSVVPYDYVRKNVSTIGSILVINSELLGLPDELAGGSLGQFNLQMNITVANYLPYSIQPQLTIIACNEGIFSTIAGSSTIMTGLLTKEIVLSTKEQVPVADSASYDRFVGGVLSNSSMANAMKLIGKHYKGLPKDLVSTGAFGALGSLGAGSSGGGSSGGRLRKHYV